MLITTIYNKYQYIKMILIQLLYSNTSHFGPPYLEHYKLNYIHCYQVINIFVNIKIKQK